MRVFGVFTGAIGGLGTVVLAQQYGVAVLTRAFTLQGLIGGALSGFIIPSTVFAFVVLIHNRRLNRLRGRLSAGAAARLTLWMLLGVLGFALVSSSSVARAEMTGPCLAIINGQDVRDLSVHPDDAIQLDPEGTVTVTVAAPRDFTHIAAGVRWAGQEFSIDESGEPDPDDKEEGGSFTGTVAVSDIAWLGGGLYEVFGRGTMTDGSGCAWDFLINVGQDPLDTLMGMAAAGASAIGAVGAMGVSVGSLLEGRAYLRDLASVVVDLDGDGVADATAFDTDADGRIDTLGFDTDGDGLIDQIAVDTDGDGVFDTAYDSSGVLEPPEVPDATDAGTETSSGGQVEVEAGDGDAGAPTEPEGGPERPEPEPTGEPGQPAHDQAPSTRGPTSDPGGSVSSSPEPSGVAPSAVAASAVPSPPAGAEPAVPSGWEGGLGAGGPPDNPLAGFDGGGGPGVCMLTGGLPNYWVSLVNRNLVVADRVYGFTAPGGDVVLQLTYNSSDTLASGQFGAGWSFSYEERLVPSGRTVYLRQGSGHVKGYLVGDAVAREGDSWILVDGEITKRFVEVSGGFVLAEVRSPSGVVVSISHEKDGRIADIADRAGRHVTFDHDLEGRCRGFRLPDGREARLEYRQGRLIRVTDLAGIATEYEYDEAGLLLELSVAGGHSSARFSYEPQGRVVIAVTDAGGHATRYRDNGDDGVEVVDPVGRRATYRSEGGRTVEITDDLGVVSTYRYEAGRLSEVTAPGIVSRFEYDGGLLVREQTNGHATRYVYDGAGELTEVRGPAGTSSYNYDIGRELTVTTPGGRRESLTWDDEGRVATARHGSGELVSFTYDRFGNLSTESNGGHTVQYGWDEWGLRLSSVTDDEGTTTFRYDGNDRPVEVVGPDGAVTFIEYGCCAATTMRYSEGSILTLQRDPMLGITGAEMDGARISATEMDPSGRVTSRTDQAGRRTRWSHDPLGRVIGVELPGGGHVAFEHTGRTLSSITDPLGRTTAFDRSGEQASLTQPSGRRLTVTRDVARGESRGRNARGQEVVVVVDPDGQPLEVDSGLGQGGRFKYDGSGHLVEETSPAYAVRYEYDALGALSHVVWSNGPTLRVSGDEWTYPSGLKVRYRYDPGVSAGVAWDGSTVTMHQARRIRQVERSNGWTSRAELDALGRVMALRDASDAQLLLDLRYERDQAGRVIAESGTAPASWLSPEPRAMTFDRFDRLDSVDGQRCAHDADDNLVAIGEAWHATYDAAGHLVSYADAAGEVSLSWDGRGRRVARQRGSEVRTFHFDPLGRLIFEAGEGEVIAEYLYLGTVPVARVAQGTTTFFHVDGLGNLVGTSDSTGALTGVFAYGPWGEHLGTPAAPPFTWQGGFGVVDEGNGVYTIGARAYLSRTGRFCQPDPAGGDGGLNLYAFAGGDPVNGTDTTGTEGTWKWLQDDFEESIELVSGWGRRAAAQAQRGVEWLRDTALPNVQDYVRRRVGTLNESYNPLHHALNKDLPKVQVGPNRSIEENLRNFGDVQAIQTRYRQTAARAARDVLTNSSPGAQVDSLISTTQSLANGKYGDAAQDLAERALDSMPLSEGIQRAKDRLDQIRDLRDKADQARRIRDITTGCGGK